MSRIVLNYTVPVRVVVNLDTKEAEQVVVLDDEARPDFRPDPYDRDTYEVLKQDDPRVALAGDIADDADWPYWAFGW